MQRSWVSIIMVVFLLGINFVFISNDDASGEDVLGSPIGFSGGSGTTGDPYQISDVYELQNMSSNLSAHYVLINDINASVTKTWNSGAGFSPVGSSSSKFTGSLDSRGFNITNLVINRNSNDVGLFGYLYNPGKIINASLLEFDIKGNSNVGGLVGYNYDGTISHCYAAGKINSSGLGGGLVGRNDGTLSNCSTTGNVNGNSQVGGLVGRNSGTVSNSYATSNVSGTINIVGGFMGYNDGGIVSNSYATGNVRGGKDYVGGFVGWNYQGLISYCYAIINVTGIGGYVGGLVGYNQFSTVSNSYATGNVRGNNDYVGGLVGHNNGTVSNSYATGNISGGNDYVGGLVGRNDGTVSNSYATGNICGSNNYIGGLVGNNGGAVSNSHYNIDNSLINNGTHFTYGGLYNVQFNDWLSNNFSLKISDYSSSLVLSGGYYCINSIQGLKDLLGFAAITNYKYRLQSDIDLASFPGFFIQYFGAAEFDGNNHTISNLQFNINNDYIGLFGYNNNGIIKNIVLVKNNVKGYYFVGGLVGQNSGTVSNCHVTGNVSGSSFVGGLVGRNNGTVSNKGTVSNCHVTGNVSGSSFVGGLVGLNYGTVSNCYVTCNVSGTGNYIGGLVGQYYGTVSNSHYNIDNSLINNGKHVTRGGLYNAQFNDWLLNDLTLNITDYSSTLVLSGGYYGINNIQGLKDLLGFADVTNYKFRLQSDINLASYPGLFIPFFAAAEFDGNNHTLSNLKINLNNDHIGLFGYNNGVIIKNTRLINNNVMGNRYVGSLMGFNNGGTVSRCSATGIVRASLSDVGGLVGINRGTVLNCYTTGNVIGTGHFVGGLLGVNDQYGTVSDCSATGNVSGTNSIGGLVGINYRSEVLYSFATGNVSGSGSVGGLVGNHWDGTVSNCYATGKVIATSKYSGGLVGWNTGAVSACYSTGQVGGSSDVGGLVGYNDGGTVTNSFWNKVTSGQSSSAGGTGKTTQEMKTKSTFINAGWDFDDIWCMIEKVTYPLLKWWDKNPPVANAGVDLIVDEGVVVKFDGRLSRDDIGIVFYTWSFWDGSLVKLYDLQPEYKFENPGDFIVLLNVTDPVGNWATDTLNVTVNDITPPIANAGLDQVINEKDIVYFNGNLSSDNVEIINVSWTFKDQKLITLYGFNPSYQFENPGTFNINLKVIDNAGNFDIDTMTVTVNDITHPIANAGPDQVIDEGMQVTFDGGLCSDNVLIVGYTWTFMDQNYIILTGIQPTYKFENPGTFDINLKVIDNAGNWDNDTMTVTVNDITPPIANAGKDLVIDEGEQVTFDGSLSRDNVAITNYTWTFTDGSPVTLFGLIPIYQFENPGIFFVTLNVTDSRGNWNETIMKVTVLDITDPIIIVQSITVDEDTILTFDGTQCFDNVGIENWTWSFKDAGKIIILYGVSPSYTFHEPGAYNVSLVLTDLSHNDIRTHFMVTVKDVTKPTVTAGSDLTIKVGVSFVLRGDGSDNVGIVNWTWVIDNGKNIFYLYGKIVKTEFNEPGNYKITLTARDSAGNFENASFSITVEGKKETISNDDNSSWLYIISGMIVVIIVILLVFLFILKPRMGKKKRDDDVDEKPLESSEQETSPKTPQTSVTPSTLEIPKTPKTPKTPSTPQTPTPTDIKDLAIKGTIAYGQGNYTEAILAWQQVVEKEPGQHLDIEMAMKDALEKIKGR